MDKLSKGKSNFENVLSSQQCVFGKARLGFNPHSKHKSISKPFSTFFEKQPIEKLKQPVVTCFFCMKRGHSVRYCRIRKKFVPKGILRWVPKVSKDFKVPVNPIGTHGPKFKKGSNLSY